MTVLTDWDMNHKQTLTNYWFLDPKDKWERKYTWTALHLTLLLDIHSQTCLSSLPSGESTPPF